MKSIMIALIIATLTIFNLPDLKSQVMVIRKPVPPSVLAVKPVKPGNKYIWIEGHWKWNKKRNKYVWMDGYWTKKKNGKVYISGHWSKKNKGWSYVPGHWK